MSRALALATLAGAAAALLGGGCSQHQTEMILVITTEGVRIPDDVHKVHLTVADRQPSLDDTVYEQDVELCNPTLSSGCYDIPVTAALFPGKAHGRDSVRVQVDAVGANGVVISDAALFTFADRQSLRLDFVLYGNCLGNVECAKRDQACGPLDTCVDLKPGQTHGPLDLALPPTPEDQSVPLPADMTIVDLAGADLTVVPPDLTTRPIDMAGCAGVVCDMGQQCVAGSCQPCGGLGQACCVGGGTGGGGCFPPNTVCNGSTCQLCGSTGELCCSGMSCFGGDTCSAGTCEPPVSIDMAQAADMFMTPMNDMAMSTSTDLF
jgi:hypothetical protein